MVDFSKQPTSWKIIMEPQTGIVIISEENVTYVILSKADGQVPYGESVGTKEDLMLQPGCHKNCGCYNQVQLYSSVVTKQHH